VGYTCQCFCVSLYMPWCNKHSSSRTDRERRAKRNCRSNETTGCRSYPPNERRRLMMKFRSFLLGFVFTRPEFGASLLVNTLSQVSRSLVSTINSSGRHRCYVVCAPGSFHPEQRKWATNGPASCTRPTDRRYALRCPDTQQSRSHGTANPATGRCLRVREGAAKSH